MAKTLHDLTPAEVELLARRIESEEDLTPATKKRLLALLDANLSNTPVDDAVAALPAKRRLIISETGVRIFVREITIISRAKSILSDLPDDIWDSAVDNAVQNSSELE